jgi:hypothetical protein
MGMGQSLEFNKVPHKYLLERERERARDEEEVKRKRD